MAAETASPSALLAKTWRMAFLTLRDETLSRPTTAATTPIGSTADGSMPANVIPLLHDLILPHTQSLVAAVPRLPSHEVSSDLIYLLNLAARITPQDEDATDVLIRTCQLIHDLTLHAPLELSSSSWAQLLDTLAKLVDAFLVSEGSRKNLIGDEVSIKAITNCLEIARRLIVSEQRRYTLLDNIHLVKFLNHVILCSHLQLQRGSCFGSHQNDFEVRNFKHDGLWMVETIAFGLIGEAILRVGSSLPVDCWQSLLEVIRKVMDTFSSKMLLLEDSVRSRFFTSLLNCLHLVLVNRKGSLSDHVVSIVSVLRMFLSYGLNSSHVLPIQKSESHPVSIRSGLGESKKADSGAYRPPHLRRKSKDMPLLEETSRRLLERDSTVVNCSSSDSDYSDSDGPLKDSNISRGCKARVAAITCIQDLCEADPKAFIAQWTMLLPTSDMPSRRKSETTLMSCLLFDPHMKARIASASAIATMLDGPSSVALQVAEYKETTRCGSYTALSSSLGQILMKLHTDVLNLIRREMHAGLLTSLFKIIMLLISSTPYTRMPDELLPSVISSLCARIQEGFSFKSNQTGLLAAAISCSTSALSVSPPSPQVHEILQIEISSGSIQEGGGGILGVLFQQAEQVTNLPVCFEALQALKAVCHNYPSIMVSCWKKVSIIVLRYLRSDIIEVFKAKGPAGNLGSGGEKVVAAAVKVLDECLRAISGFQGAEDVLGDKLIETPFTSDCVRDKKVSSAPSYAADSLNIGRNMPKEYPPGQMEWCEALQKHIPLTLCHASAMVRAACITCFAGITSTIFFSLEKENQDFILSSCIKAAVSDEVPSVRSAACRAIGVIACFPDVLKSADILNQLINVVELNSRDKLMSVRIPASWALANLCDSLRYSVKYSSIDFMADSQMMIVLSECALRLTEDGDKIKSNGVRALGNLSRIIHFPSHDVAAHLPNSSLVAGDIDTLPSACCLDSYKYTKPLSQSSSSGSTRAVHLLERIVQAFLSCVTTGNVKVQWNVCHALSNFFLNETIRFQQMDWAQSVYSILLLLLRDSTNFKIRIQAAAALAVPVSVSDYGRSFPNVVQGLVHILENMGSVQTSMPSNLKYKSALDKQLTSTMLHVLKLCPSSNSEPLKEFLLKKASFFGEWFEMLCSSLEEESSRGDGEQYYIKNKKVDLISKAIKSLSEVYKSKNHRASVQRLEEVLDRLLD